MDLPAHEHWEELESIAKNRDRWRKLVNKIKIMRVRLTLTNAIGTNPHTHLLERMRVLRGEADGALG